MKISYIMPRYNESEGVVERALTSFDMQQMVKFDDFNIIIVDDHSKRRLSESFLNRFKNIHIEYFYLDRNVGPSGARQVGINNSRADYIGFCDADDMLFDSVSVANMVQLTDKNPDIIITCGFEEQEHDGRPFLIRKGNDMIFMHGKAIRIEFLMNNGIAFDESLRVHEDSNILSKCFAMTDNIVNSDITTYIWKNNKNSITRRNNASYTSDSLAEYVHAMELSLRYIKENASEDTLRLRVSGLVAYIYGVLNARYFDKSYTEDVEKITSEVVSKYIKEIQEAPYEYWIEAMRIHSGDIFNAQISAKETLTQFINRMYQMKQEKNN